MDVDLSGCPSRAAVAGRASPAPPRSVSPQVQVTLPSTVRCRASACSWPTTSPTHAITHANRPIRTSRALEHLRPLLLGLRRMRGGAPVGRPLSGGSSSTRGWTSPRRPGRRSAGGASGQTGWRDAWHPAFLWAVGAVELLSCGRRLGVRRRARGRRVHAAGVGARPRWSPPTAMVVLLVMPWSASTLDEPAAPIAVIVLGLYSSAVGCPTSGRSVLCAAHSDLAVWT